MVSPKVSLTVNGRKLSEWTDVNITRSLTSLADSFSLGYVDVHTRIDYPIKVGDECVVRIGTTKVITGYVDVAEWSYTAGGVGASTSHRFNVEGRSRSGDLVDSSLVPDPSTWKEKTFLTIAKQICAPYGITPIVSANVDALVMTPIRRHSVEIGESPGDCLGRLAQKLGVLLRTTADGKLEIGRPPKLIPLGALTLTPGGARIKSGSRRSDHRQRHDLYIAFGQRQGSATIGNAAREGKQSATDKRVTRYRPLVFIQDGSSTTGTLQRAAEWTRNTRAGQSERVSYTVYGWESIKGLIWEPGKTIICNDDLLRLKKKGLIVESVNFMQGAGTGTEAKLDLVNPEAFVSLSPPTKPKITDGVITW